jgi:hypothetical protein
MTSELLSSKQPSNLPQLLRDAERRVNEHVWGDRRAIVSISADVSRDVDILLLTAADQIEAMASVGIRQEREIERLRAGIKVIADAKNVGSPMWGPLMARDLLKGLPVETVDAHAELKRLRKQMGVVAVLLLQNDRDEVMEWARGVKLTFKDGDPELAAVEPESKPGAPPDDQRDALRYRFIREDEKTFAVMQPRRYGHVAFNGDGLDAAVDSAMAEEPMPERCLCNKADCIKCYPPGLSEKATAKLCDHRRGVDDSDRCVMCGESIPPLNRNGDV